MKRGAFETGTYRNVFAEAGYDKETIEKRKNEIFHTLFYGAESERIYHPVEDDMAYIEDTGNHDARTEGMSYGMMMCVQMDRKEEFDRLWKWAKTYMYLEEGENAGYFAWSVQLDGTKNSFGAAPDGEEFFADGTVFRSAPLGRRRRNIQLQQGSERVAAHLHPQGRKRRGWQSHVGCLKSSDPFYHGCGFFGSVLSSASFL